eukprot:contig_24566_g6056
MAAEAATVNGGAPPTKDTFAHPLIRTTKTLDVQTVLMDSTAWDGFPFRADDVLVATYGKAGTSWMQAILGHLLLGVGSDAAARPQAVSPWLDMRSATPVAERHAALAAQTHRRFLKSHLPLDALPYSPDLKYIYIGRDARDLIWSMHNHHTSLLPEALAALNALPGRVGPPMGPAPTDPVAYWRDWMDGDGAPWWPFWSHTRAWWAARSLPNVLLLHYADMLADLPAAVRRVAAFLAVPVTPEDVATITERCSFAYMRAHAADVVPGGGHAFRGGAEAFIHKGTNGRWRGMLSEEDVATYEARAVAELGDDCARWLREGGSV